MGRQILLLLLLALPLGARAAVAVICSHFLIGSMCRGKGRGAFRQWVAQVFMGKRCLKVFAYSPGTRSAVLWDRNRQVLFFIEPWNGLSCKGPQCSPSSNPLLCDGRQPAAQAAQSHIQPGLECLQGWGIHSLLGQPVQCVTTLWGKNFLLITNLTLPCLS